MSRRTDSLVSPGKPMMKSLEMEMPGRAARSLRQDLSQGTTVF
jgi:hypothetical protein